MDKNLETYFIESAKIKISKLEKKYEKSKTSEFNDESQLANIRRVSLQLAVKDLLDVNLIVPDKNLEKEILETVVEKNLVNFINNSLSELLENINSKIALSSHCCKFTNSKISRPINIWATNKRRNDGYIRTGNFGNTREDVSIPAQYLGLAKFLFLEFEDGNTLYYHLKNNTEIAINNFSGFSLSYEDIRKSILTIKHGEDVISTDNKLRQVFFPVGNNQYHLLSVLYPSYGLFYLKRKYAEYYFSDKAKESREARRKDKFSEEEVHDLYNLVEIKFGGAQPQNVSYNNSKFGSCYMFTSEPPLLKKRNVRLPYYNFFKECLWTKKYQSDFKDLHDVFCINYNNQNIRSYRDKVIFNIFDKIIEQIDTIRLLPSAWSEDKKYSNLPNYQKVILDSKYEGKRFEDVEIKEFLSKIATWIIFSFKQKNFKDSFVLGDTEISFINKLLLENGEVLL